MFSIIFELFFVVCPNCGNSTCDANGLCCDELCVGCELNKPSKCLSCRYLSIGTYPNQQCVQKCPADTYEHDNRRCIDANECRSIPRPVFPTLELNLVEYPYIPNDGKCSYSCPRNYYPDGPNGQRQCVPCGAEG